MRGSREIKEGKGKFETRKDLLKTAYTKMNEEKRGERKEKERVPVTTKRLIHTGLRRIARLGRWLDEERIKRREVKKKREWHIHKGTDVMELIEVGEEVLDSVGNVGDISVLLLQLLFEEVANS